MSENCKRCVYESEQPSTMCEKCKSDGFINFEYKYKAEMESLRSSFYDAIHLLNEVTFKARELEPDAQLFLSSSSLNLLTGPAHGVSGERIPVHTIFSSTIESCTGGDW